VAAATLASAPPVAPPVATRASSSSAATAAAPAPDAPSSTASDVARELAALRRELLTEVAGRTDALRAAVAEQMVAALAPIMQRLDALERAAGPPRPPAA
jgi:hypothetical protein